MYENQRAGGGAGGILSIISILELNVFISSGKNSEQEFDFSPDLLFTFILLLIYNMNFPSDL